MRKMTQIDALKTLISDARNEKLTRASYNRVHRALVSLDLTDTDIVELEQHLEYRNDSGQLYKYLTGATS